MVRVAPLEEEKVVPLEEMPLKDRIEFLRLEHEEAKQDPTKPDGVLLRVVSDSDTRDLAKRTIFAFDDGKGGKTRLEALKVVKFIRVTEEERAKRERTAALRAANQASDSDKKKKKKKKAVSSGKPAASGDLYTIPEMRALCEVLRLMRVCVCL